ncbi:MAG: hypothetical protein OXC44_02065 [Proteobacteria bacterium]|nr:hypothetical protein [Pseudomonadota bacterium]
MKNTDEDIKTIKTENTINRASPKNRGFGCCGLRYVGCVLMGWITVMAMIVVAACRESEVFEPIGDKVVYPSAMVSDGDYFYVVNSDLERQYNAGSVMVLDKNGEKRGVITTPRLGRFAVVRGKILLVGHGQTDQYTKPPQLRAYDISDPDNIRFLSSSTLECIPINAVARKDYPYFAVSCMNGKLYVGEWSSDAASKASSPFTLSLVRDYGPHPRRALHIDTQKGLIYAFPTDADQVRLEDIVLGDYQSKAGNGTVEYPDKWENIVNLTGPEKRDLIRQFQYAIYPIESEKQRGFPYASAASDEVAKEVKWLYFNDDSSLRGRDKHYRTNFWQALPDPKSKDAFYISKRSFQSRDNLSVGNAVYRFRFKSSPLKPLKDGGKDPLTSDVLQVERVWGHDPRGSVVSSKVKSNVEFDDSAALMNRDIRFTGNFDVGTLGTSSDVPHYLVVNDFRNAVYFKSSSYALSLKSLAAKASSPAQKDAFLYFSTERSQSFFSLASLGSRVMAGAFFSDSLTLFDVAEDLSLNPIKRIR